MIKEGCLIDKKKTEDFELAGFVLWMARTRAIPQSPSPSFYLLLNGGTCISLGTYGGDGTMQRTEVPSYQKGLPRGTWTSK